ncbi:MAG: phosphatidate cytidylyltransferase [Actinomycetota bacterium]|nr:phosphatidate cytidylyltransferase [Actinomycetota bacterium]
MAEFVGPVDSEDEKSSVYGDYRFESKSVENSGNEGFQLPPWTDPPTGEIPAVLSEMDSDEYSTKFRLPSLKFSSLFNSAAEDASSLVAERSDGLASESSDESDVASRTRRHSREGRPYKRPAIRSSGPEALKISSRTDSTRRSRLGDVEQSRGVSDEVFRPPEEIELPSKRYNVSMPKLSRRRRRKSGTSSGFDSVAPLQGEIHEVTNPNGGEDDSGFDEFAPSSYASRRERIYRAKANDQSSRSSRKGSVYLRVSTGIALGAIVLLAFHFGSETALAAVTVGIVLAVIEFYDTLRRAGFKPAALLGIAGTVSLLITTYQKGANGIALVFASMVLASMLWYLVGVIRGQPTLNISVTFLGFLWIGGLGSFGAAMLRPQDFPAAHGVAYLMGAIIATVANDTAAYFVGSWFGRHKLAPEISPTKSWEGLIAGAIASLIFSAVIVSQISPWTVSNAIILGIVVAIVAPLGDLAESMIKRDLQIKDMGKLLPGHGGMLDRIDGLLFVLPTVYYLLKILHLG